MKLIGTPYKITIRSKKTSHHCWILPTNQGDLTADEAARIVGLTTSAMRTRVNRVVAGIIRPEHIFVDRRSMLLRRATKMDHRVVTDEFCQVPDEDIGKYAHLSGRLRDYNMARIRRIGTWEARHIKVVK